PANETLESRNARLILGQHIGGRRVAVEPTGLGLGDPDLNQIAADPVAPGEGVQWLPTQKFLDDLALELDRMRAVLGHGLSPRKPGSVSRFSPSPSVHPKGCTPILCPNLARSRVLLLKARYARGGARWLVEHGDDINWRQNRGDQRRAHQPSAVGQALHRVQRQIKQPHRLKYR